MNITGAKKNKVSELFFFILWGLVLICSISFNAYVRNLELYDNRLLIMTYITLIRPLIGVSFILLSAGLLAKVGFLDVGRLSAKEKKILFFIGLILVAILVFYMLLMGVLCIGLQYTETDNWVKVVIRSELYNILYQPFRSTYYKDVYLFRDIVGILGVFFLFLAKTKLGVVRRENVNENGTKKSKVGGMIFFILCGLVFVCSVVYRIYAEKATQMEGVFENILPGTIYLILIKPLVFISAALLIAGLLSKIGLLNTDRLSAKAKRILFIIGLVLVSITVFYMLLLGVLCTGLQFTEADNWVKALISSKAYITLTEPFSSHFGEEMYLIRNIAVTIGSLFLFFGRTAGTTPH